MRIGITGGTGYIGSALALKLIPDTMTGASEVDLLDIRPPSPELQLRLQRSKIHYIKMDVADGPQFSKLAQNYDVLIHLAGLVGYPACQREPERAVRENVTTTENLLRFKRKDARVVYASTINVYGEQLPRDLVSETSPVHPTTTYAETKLRGEELVTANGKHVILRYAVGFGHSPKTRHDVMVNDFVRRATAGETLSVYENTFVRQFVHVSDMANAIVFALGRWNSVAGNIYNVGNPTIEITKRQLTEMIAGQYPFPYRFEDSGADMEKRNYRVSFQKFIHAGFQPKMSLAAGISELIHYYSANTNKEQSYGG